MPKLLSDSESSSDEEQTREERLNVNKKYASQLEKRERFKDLQRANELLGEEEEEDDSESETEDEDAELLSPELDLKIVNTINSLRKKDPRIYDKNSQWFSDGDDDDEEDDEEDAQSSKDKKKKYKDVLREQLLKEGNAVDEYELEEDLKASHRLKADNLGKKQLAYDEEQAELRKAFLDAAKSGDGSSEEDSEKEEIVRVKSKSARERRAEEQKLTAAIEEMTKLGSFVEDDKDKDAFLTNYLLKKMWKDPAESGGPLGDDIDTDEDEEAVEEAELFENKYNFRFEELQDAKARMQEDHNDSSSAAAFGLGLAFGSAQVIGHARNVPDSLRREDDKDKRKAQREARKERKEREKRQKAEELKRLKNIKKQALQERLAQIGMIGGLSKIDGLDASFLDEDWDPEKHEALMASQYNDDYYTVQDEDLVHPDSLEDDPTTQALLYDDLGYEEEEAEVEVNDKKSKKKAKKAAKKAKNVTFDEEADAEQYAEDLPQDPEQAKQEVAKLMDEYYALDYEDIVAGMPCRFKYKTVEAEDFGLDTSDILLADDRELNRYVSLKHLAPYNPKKWSKSEKELKHKQKHLKHSLRAKIAELAEQEEQAQLQQQQQQQKAEEQQAAEAVASAGGDGGNKRKRRKRKQSAADDAQDLDQHGDQDATDAAPQTAPVASTAGREGLQPPKPPKRSSKDKAADSHKDSKDNNKDKKKFRDDHKKKPKNKEKNQSEDDPVKKRMKLYE